MRVAIPLRARLRLVLTATLLLGGALRADGPKPGGPALPDEVQAARDLLRAHRAGAALERLEAAGGLSPTAPERSWLLVQLLPALRGLTAARAAVEAFPRGEFRAALGLLLAEDAARAKREGLVGMRTVSDPWRLLAWAGLEARLGEHASAAGWARAARRRGGAFVACEAGLLEARCLLELGRLEEALALTAQACPAAPRDPRALGLASEALRRAGRLPEAQELLLAALESAPRYEPYAHRLAELLREESPATWPARLGPRLRALAPHESPEGQVLLSMLDEHEGALEKALAGLRSALERGASPVPVERGVRLLLARLGRWRELEQALRAAIPREALESPGNLQAPRWDALARTVAALPARPPREAGLVALAEALAGLGALAEARAALEGCPGPAGRALDERVRGHLALEAGLRAEVEAGYRRALRHQGLPSVDALLARLAALAERHLVPAERASFRAPATGLRRMPPLGAWLDHRARSAAPVVRHFRAYGRYLVLGQRTGQPCEAIVFSLGALEEAATLVTRGATYRHDFALGYDRVLRSFLDMQGGGLSGACLPDGLWLDADAALEAEHAARSRLRRDPSLAQAAARIPRPRADGPDGPFALGDPAGVHMRLLARYVARAPHGRWGSLGTLRAHENGHVIDLDRHLPFWRGLPATMALLASAGFSMTRAEAVLERRAQLAAVIDAPDPDLALCEMLEMLPAEERDADPHARGYRDGLDLLVRHVWSRPDLYPQIDRTRRVLPQLDLLAPDQLRAAARAVVDR